MQLRKVCIALTLIAALSGSTVTLTSQARIAPIFLAATVIVLMNIIACYRVLKSELYEPKQKIFQCMLVWLFPILGTGLVLAVMHEPEMKNKRGYSRPDATFNFGDDIGNGWGSGDFFVD